jgi:cobalt-zinc-cadmium efflux system membrane fusion protein
MGTVRVVIDNASGEWRPGTFVKGSSETSDSRAEVLVRAGAVQTVDDETVVFVRRGEAFYPTPVVTGRSDAVNVEIVSGLSAGQEYVADGAFALKAVVITSGMDSHAGHGH